MLKDYHRTNTVKALREQFSEVALGAIISANLNQDHLIKGQIGHPHYHVDENSFGRSFAYLEKNRAMIRPALEKEDVMSAWQAFGRLTHVGQDLYAHSNYVTLWLGRFPADSWPPADSIDPLDQSILAGPDLRSGKIYWPLEPLSWIPAIKRFILPLIPRDSHAWMNLDAPECGPKFAYAFAAAVKRTRHEFNLTVQAFPPALLSCFTGTIN